MCPEPNKKFEGTAGDSVASQVCGMNRHIHCNKGVGAGSCREEIAVGQVQTDVFPALKVAHNWELGSREEETLAKKGVSSQNSRSGAHDLVLLVCSIGGAPAGCNASHAHNASHVLPESPSRGEGYVSSFPPATAGSHPSSPPLRRFLRSTIVCLSVLPETVT